MPALVLGYFLVIDRFERELNLRVRVPMQQYADVLAQGMGVAIWNFDQPVALELVDAVMRNPAVLRIVVLDDHGVPFVQKAVPHVSEAAVLRDSRPIYYASRPVGQLSIELSSEQVEKDLRTDLLKLGAALIAQMFISFIFILVLFERRMIQPLRALESGAVRLARGELDQVLELERKDEIGNLAQGLDKMREDLRNLIAERDIRNAALETELAERRRIEQELRFSQDKFSAIFHASPVAMTVSRQDNAVVLADVNDAWLRQFGRSREQSVGRDGIDLGFWQHQQDRSTVLDTITSQGEIARHPVWLCCAPPGEALLCEVSGRSIAFASESLLILAYVDITAKQRYEHELQDLNATLERRVAERTQALSRTLKELQLTQRELVRSEKMSALGSLVAGIAHELNTPIGNSLMIGSTLQDRSNEFAASMGQGMRYSDLIDFVDQMREGNDILLRNLRKSAELIASFKQVAIDQSSDHRRLFNLRDMFSEVILTLGPSIKQTRHIVACQIPPDIEMESYPGPLGQIITNLINNTFLHAFEGDTVGLVTITARSIGSDMVEITVGDNGVGISPANLNRIFDPFFTTKLGHGGSGLGLHIVYNLVTSILGGSIAVDSIAGQGTRFTLCLPVVGMAESLLSTA